MEQELLNGWKVADNYPIVKTITSRQPWIPTGVLISKGNRIVIQADPNGRWTANPTNGPYDANGLGISAKDGYCLIQGTEGALVGKFGERELFFQVGLHALIDVPARINHELFLSINDDIDGRHGNGFTDNNGSITVTITVYD